MRRSGNVAAGIEVEVRGVNRVMNAFRPLLALKYRVFEPIIYRWAQKMRATLKGTPYPPKRPMQTYVRTGRLANSWGVIHKGPGLYIIRNSTNYGGYVVGDNRGEGQAWMHIDRWWIARPIVEAGMPQLRADIYRKVEQMTS